MSVAKSALFSGIRGTFGNIVVYEVNGQTRIRTKPGGYKDCKSEKQLQQRQRFKKVTELYHSLDMGLNAAWKQMTQGTNLTAFNLFVKTNIRNFTAEGKIADPARLKVCCGRLPLSEGLQATISPDGTVSLNWQYNSLRKEGANELLKLVLYEPERKGGPGIYIRNGMSVLRKEGHCDFCLPDTLKGNIHLYILFWGRYTNEFSDSAYIGSLEKEEPQL